MKALAGWLLLGLLLQAQAQEALNYNNVLLLQVDHEQLDDPEWLQAWLGMTAAATLRKMKRHGRDAWAQKTMKQLSMNLKKQRRRLMKEGLFIDRTQQLLDYDEKQGGAPLVSTFYRYLIQFQGKGNSNRFIDRGLSVLLLNPQDEMRVLPFRDQKSWAEWNEIREIEQGHRRARTLHVRYLLKPGRKIQKGVLEVVIQGYSYAVEDYTRLKKMGEKHWKPDLAVLRVKNPLAEGFSNRLVPIHSLMINGMSLGEIMIRFPEGACKERQPLQQQRLFICTQPGRYSADPGAEYVYLGGQLLRMRYYRHMDPGQGMPASQLRWAQKKLGYPAKKWKALEWKKGRALLKSEALPAQADEHWLFFEATHGQAPDWLKTDYKALP